MIKKSSLLHSLVLLIVLFFIFCYGEDKMNLREPYVSNKFYEGDKVKLSNQIDLMLSEAVGKSEKKPKGLIVPHAGYVFSGQIAADGFNQAKGFEYDTVIILGTNHTTYPEDIGFLYDGEGFKTPLGICQIDKDLNEKLAQKGDFFKFNNSAHFREHSIEVQIPFIQKIFQKIKIVPIVIGTSKSTASLKIGKALADVVKGKNVLIVASSDLSHYPPFDVANFVDKELLKAITTMDLSKIEETAKNGELKEGVETSACGIGPIMVLVTAMNELNSRKVKIVSYANSGQTIMGDLDRVVGYGAVAFYEGEKEQDIRALNFERDNEELNELDKEYLLKLARTALNDYLNYDFFTLPRFPSRALFRKQGAFVTLEKYGELRGCIGHMAEDTPLSTTVAKMALASALQDTRFYPVTKDELSKIEIEISVLTPMKEVKGIEEIIIGKHGTVIRKGGRSAVFLPQVAVEQGWTKEEMLEHLCLKAGLPKDAYKSGCKFYTFEAIVFKEKKK